jgi:hypothetical protein
MRACDFPMVGSPVAAETAAPSVVVNVFMLSRSKSVTGTAHQELSGAAHGSDFHHLDRGLRDREVRVMRERLGGRFVAVCLHD